VVNGNRPGSNYYLLDGVDMTDSYLSTAPVFPAPDALQEFDIQTSNFTAQYGRSSGGLINAASKAGTNEFHGGVFEFFRNTVLDSHNYFDVAGEAKPALKLNQYGGYAGGPIQKGKTFFFGYFQGTKQRADETISIGTVYTALENPANPSNSAGVLFPANTIVDPLTGRPFATDGFIPSSRLDPTAVKMITKLLNIAPNNGSGGYTFHAPIADNEDSLNENQFLGRIDHNFGTKDLVFGRYFFNQDLSTGVGAGNMNLPHDKYFRNQNAAGEWNHTFSSRLINTAVFGFTRIAHHRGTLASDGWDTFGSMPGTQTAGIPTEFYLSINGGPNNGGDGTFVQDRQTWQYTDYISYLKGKHEISAGGDFRKESVNRVEDYYTDPIFSFNGQYTTPAGSNSSTTTALADMLLGLPNYFNLQTEVASDLRHKAMDMYVGDNYKVSKHLTVDAGFRWEPFLPPVDNLNDQICFDPTLKSQSAFYPTAPPGFTFPGPALGSGSNGTGDPGCPRSMVPDRWKNVAPRLGLNISPFSGGKTSIRAAYGIFWDQARLIAWNRYSTAQPFDENFLLNGFNGLNTTNGVSGLPSNGALTGNTVFTYNPGVINPFPFYIPRTVAQRQAFSPSYTQNGVAYWPTSAEGTVLPPNFNEGYAGQWNLSIDQEIAKNYVVTVSYIGNKGTHLFMSRDINYAPVTSSNPSQAYNPALTLTQNIANEPTRRLIAFDGNCGTNTVTGTPNPCLGQTQEEDNGAWSTYEALAVSLNHRYSNGFSLMASYVWAKYLDIISYGAEGGLGPRDPTDFRLNYGPSDSDVANRVTASYIYQLPKLKSAHGVLAGMINDWQNQGILIAQTGSPYTITSNNDTAATGIGGDYADWVSGVSDKPAHRGVSSYFNKAAFTEAADGTFGNTSRGMLFGPSLVNMDFSLFKEFPIHDAGKVQFRSEFFNLFNHPNFGNPDSGIGDGTFGQLTNAKPGRIAQFALKYLF
jgi:hypothetical protein